MEALVEIEIDLIEYSVDLGIRESMLLDPAGVSVSGKNMPALKKEDFDDPNKISTWYAELPQPITDDNGLELIIAASTLTNAQWIPQSFEIAGPLAKSLTNAYLKSS
ncbi:MAG: hypothetical protein AAF569_06370 [Pseudomonadota bacterium]